MMTRVPLLATPLVLVAALALGGCSVLPGISGVTTGDDSGSSDGGTVVEQESMALPDDFPSDIPLVSDDVATFFELGDAAWSVIVRVDDATEGFDAASALLIDAGLVKNDAIGSGSLGIFESDKYTVKLTSFAESDFDSAVVQYTIAIL